MNESLKIRFAWAILLSVALLGCDGEGKQSDLELVDHYLDLSNGNTMHYYDVGKLRGKVLLLVHGYPASAYLYRHIIRDLCGASNSPYRCIAMTHIGFGKSSCPGDGSAISPLYEVDQLEAFIERMGIDDFAAIVHDWGGPIGTAAALRHVDKLTHLVLLNTILTLPPDGALHSLMATTKEYFSEPRPFLERIYPHLVSVLMQMMTSTRLSEDVRSIYASPFTGEAGRCRVHATANLFSKAKQDEKLFDEIATNLKSNWSMRPAVFVWGTGDPILGLGSERGLASFKRNQILLPQAATHRIGDANHFLPEDKPAEISQEIRRFLSDVDDEAAVPVPIAH